MESQPDTTASALSDGVQRRFGIDVSAKILSKVRRSLGWTRKATRYCHMIRNDNKIKRFNWCTEQLRNNENFDDVIFTDECRVEVNDISKVVIQENRGAM